MILATCVLLVAATLEIRAENATDVTAEYAELFKSGKITLKADSRCKSEGAHPINCTSYLVCVRVNGDFLSAEGTCPTQQNFDPSTRLCSSTYVCTSCTKAGLVCPTSTTFTLCADVGVEIVSNIPCPAGFYCNQKCSLPCLNYIPSC